MNKFNIGDEVTSKIDKDKAGLIKCIIEKTYDNRKRYSYLIYNESCKRYYLEFEEFIKLIRKLSQEEDSDRVKQTRSIIESTGYESDLKMGDIVTFRSGLPIGECVVSSVSKTESGEELYEYGLISTAEIRSNEYYTCRRLMLEFQYHDKKWEEYVTESVRNNLPAWRGELYNLYELYVDVKDHKLGFTEDAEEYSNHIIPPEYMEHILGRHTVYGRITPVLASDENKKTIMKKLNIRDKVNFNRFIFSFREKVEKRNGVNYTKGDAVHFSPIEVRFAELIDLLDTESIGNGKQQYVCYNRKHKKS